MLLPLKNCTVLEYGFSLAAGWAGLRFAELGAKVLKWPGRDAAWMESLKDLHSATMNRGKELVELGGERKEQLEELLKQSDVLLCPKGELAIEALRIKFPAMIVVEFSAWGAAADHWKWSDSDLLAQAVGGLTYTTGSHHDLPTPFGYNIADYLCGNQSVQFVLGALLARRKSGGGCLIQLSLIESILDFQFEFLTTFYQSRKQPLRAAVTNANAILSAPYGVYKTRNGFIAIAMMPLAKLNEALECEELNAFAESDAFGKRDEIKSIITHHLLSRPNEWWLERAKQLDLWMMPVLNWQNLIQTDAYRKLSPTGMPIRFMNAE